MGIRMCYSNTMSLPQRPYYHFTLCGSLNSLVYHNIIIVFFVNTHIAKHCHLPTDVVYLIKIDYFSIFITIISHDTTMLYVYHKRRANIPAQTNRPSHEKSFMYFKSKNDFYEIDSKYIR